MFLVGKFKYFCRLFADLIAILCKKMNFFANSSIVTKYCKGAIYGILRQLSQTGKFHWFGFQPDHIKKQNAPDSGQAFFVPDLTGPGLAQGLEDTV